VGRQPPVKVSKGSTENEIFAAVCLQTLLRQAENLPLLSTQSGDDQTQLSVAKAREGLKKWRVLHQQQLSKAAGGRAYRGRYFRNPSIG
jgi:hypothetical protein